MVTHTRYFHSETPRKKTRYAQTPTIEATELITLINAKISGVNPKTSV